MCVHSVAKSCLTLHEPMHYTLPGSSVHEISQVRILECLPFSSPGDFPNQGIKRMSSVSPTLFLLFYYSDTWEA